jgi:hypothetical protein
MSNLKQAKYYKQYKHLKNNINTSSLKIIISKHIEDINIRLKNINTNKIMMNTWALKQSLVKM